MLAMEYDLFLFAGQSNMAGRGITSPQWPQPAPSLTPGAGYEYRAVSDPGHLHPMAEPFGAEENDPNGIFEPGKKTGSLVTAFVNAYYEQTGVPVVGVSASQGGTEIAQWQGQQDLLTDALGRFAQANAYLQEASMPVGHRFLVWCQGETDGDRETTPALYKARFRTYGRSAGRRGWKPAFWWLSGSITVSKGVTTPPSMPRSANWRGRSPAWYWPAMISIPCGPED